MVALRILIVDERAERASVVRQALLEAGHDVLETLRPGADLLRQLQAERPDVLVVDLDSPDRDTIEQLRSVTRELPRPIVMFVDQSDEAMMREAIGAGVSAYVVDGLSERRVRPILEMAIARFQAFEALQRELEQAKSSLAERKLVERAKGLIMQQRGLSEEEAYRLLRRAAMDQGRRLSEVAQALVTAVRLLKG